MQNPVLRFALIVATFTVLEVIVALSLGIGYFVLLYFLFHATMNLAVFSRRIMALAAGQAVAARNEEAYARVRRSLHFRTYAVVTNTFNLAVSIVLSTRANFSLLQLLRGSQ